jgi:hypothetical protein
LKFKSKPVKKGDVLSFEDFDSIVSLNLEGWYIHYVIQGDECKSITISLDEDTTLPDGSKVKDKLQAKGLTLTNIADTLRKLTGKEITIE